MQSRHGKAWPVGLMRACTPGRETRARTLMCRPTAAPAWLLCLPASVAGALGWLWYTPHLAGQLVHLFCLDGAAQGLHLILAGQLLAVELRESVR